MNRREFAGALGAGALLGTISGSGAAPTPASAVDPQGPPSGKRPKIAMLVHLDMILLDLVGPQTVFSLLMADGHLVGKTERADPATVEDVRQRRAPLIKAAEAAARRAAARLRP